MELFTAANILSVIAILMSASVIAWMRVLSKRAFKSFDDKVAMLADGEGKLEGTLADLDKALREAEKKLVRFEEFRNQVESMNKQLRADLTRETQVVSNQLDSIHAKIDQLDAKFEKFRDTRR